MPVGNLVGVKLRDSQRKTVADYSPEALTALGAITDQLEVNLNQGAQTVLRRVPGALQQIGSFNFGGGASQIARSLAKTALSPATRVAGYKEDWQNVPIPYRVVVSLARVEEKGLIPLWIIRAIQQEGISFRATSEWESFIPLGALSTANTVTQAAFGVSALTRWATRRIWKGTTPLQIELKLKFNAVRDAFREVVEPMLRLTQLVMPSEGGTVDISGIPTLGALTKEARIPVVKPPGPSPFDVNSQSVFGEGTKIPSIQRGDFIQIDIGALWSFKKVIVKEAVPKWDPKYTPEGYPIGAEVSLVFETYEILTKEALEDALVAGR